MVVSAIQQQRDYVSRLKELKFKFRLTVGEAFVRGIRDIGYKSSATALDELIDNSYEAGASVVQVAFGYTSSQSDKKPSEVAVIDNGHGMEADMIRAAVVWGGTHREDQRTGFGRYGYGLPSSAISTGRRYTVYSKPADGPLSAVTIDLDDIEHGKYTVDGDIVVPTAKPAKLPKFVQQHLEENWPNEWKHGTIVVIDKLDKLTWKTTGPLQTHLLQHFGVVYHMLRPDLDVQVNDRRVEPIDPLFITPGFRGFDTDSDRAEPIDPILIEVKDPDSREVVGKITVRLSYCPPTFASANKMLGVGRSNGNERWPILRDYHGFMFSRNGRLIDTVAPPSSFTRWQNNDRYIRVEIDFPAALDEEFSVTTSKQQIVPSDRIWKILKESGLEAAIRGLRRRWEEEAKVIKAKREADPSKEKASEHAMAKARLLNARVRPEVEARQTKTGQRELDHLAEQRAKQSGTSVETVKAELELQLAGRLYKVAQESLPGLPFFRMSILGSTRVLWLNTSSRFFQEVYQGPNSNPAVRSALEVLLFSIGDRMLDASDDLRDIYNHEIPQWSGKMEFALAQLNDVVGGTSEDPSDNEEDGEPLAVAAE